jgi:hypothetical protein
MTTLTPPHLKICWPTINGPLDPIPGNPFGDPDPADDDNLDPIFDP